MKNNCRLRTQDPHHQVKGIRSSTPTYYACKNTKLTFQEA